MSLGRQFIEGETRANPVPIGALLSLQAQRDPDRAAVTIENRTVTRRQLEEAANRRARQLADLGVRQDDLVAIALPNSIEFHETAFAVWKLGATPAPLSSRLPAAEIKAILEVMQPRVAVGLDPELCECPTASPDPNPALEHSVDALPPLAARFQKAITSGGSTGRPKVIVDHMPASLDPNVIGLGMQLDDTILLPGPQYHNAPFGIAHRALCRGAHVIGMQRFDAEGALALIERHKIGWTMLAPTMMRRIFALPREIRCSYDLSSLQMVVHMGAPCPAWLKKEWIEWLGPDAIWECYGGTERMGSVCIGGRDWLTHPGSVGRPRPGRVSVIDANGNPCGIDEVGEIRFHPAPGQIGPTYHYLGATSNADGRSDSYGDLGHFDADGFLYLDDRRTDMIVSGGANIYPAEVEAALESHPQVLAAAVVGLPDDDLGQRLHAVIEPRDIQVLPDLKELEGHVASRLARAKLPYTVDFVEGRLKDDAGKMRRSQLRAERISGAISASKFLRLRG